MSFHSYTTSRDKEKRVKSQTCCTNGPDQIFVFFSFSLHATSWHRVKSPDTPLYWSSTDFSMFPLRHLLAQSRSPRHTAQSVSDRFSFLTPHRGTFCFSLFFLHHLVAQSRSFRRIAKTVHNNYEARQTKPNTTVRTQRTLTEASRPTLLSRDKQEKRCKQHK